MTSRSVCALLLAPILLSASLALPEAVHAHALFGDYDPNRPVVEYLTLGFGHMVGGWDHLLFITGVVLLAGSVRSAAKLISFFVLGHSLTLLVATIAGWKLNATAVDVVIALSLVYVGVQGLRGRPEDFRLFGAVVFGFGLIHGLGLSTRLQALGLPEDGLVGRVLLFNVGVELGQLTALAVIVGIGALVVRAVRGAGVYRKHAFGALVVAGLVAAAVLSFPGGAGTDEEPVAKQPAPKPSGPCREQQSQPPQFIGGDHPEKYFYGPDEKAAEEDLVHVIGDGLVIVRYSPDLARPDVGAIEDLVEDPASQQYVIAAPDPDQVEPLRAIAANRTLTCTEVDVDSLAAFRDNWFLFVQQQQAP